MKLLVQSDDYGITRAVSRGIIHGIKNGVIRNTGLFANMPWSEECVDTPLFINDLLRHRPECLNRSFGTGT